MNQEQKPTTSSGNPNQNPNNKGCLTSIIFILILIWVVFFWRFIDYKSQFYRGEKENGFPSASVISNRYPISSSDQANGVQNQGTITEYDQNSNYRFIGTVEAGKKASVGPVTIRQQENPVGEKVGPRPPCVMFGNIREFNGTGAKILFFKEKEFQYWSSNFDDKYASCIVSNVFDKNYCIDISYESYYIVIDNSKGISDVYVGLTGDICYLRPLSATELGQGSVVNQNSFFRTKWYVEKSKLTIWEYILKILNPISSQAHNTFQSY